MRDQALTSLAVGKSLVVNELGEPDNIHSTLRRFPWFSPVIRKQWNDGFDAPTRWGRAISHAHDGVHHGVVGAGRWRSPHRRVRDRRRIDCWVVISDEMRADWEANRDELMEFWQSGEYTYPDTFPDSLPWLFVCGSADTLPWAARHLDWAHTPRALSDDELRIVMDAAAPIRPRESR
jgi:hypothetical protein